MEPSHSPVVRGLAAAIMVATFLGINAMGPSSVVSPSQI